MQQSESDIVRGCLQLLQARGIYCWRQNQGGIPLPNGGFRRFVGLKGVSDILGIVPQTHEGVLFGNLLAVECKTEKGKVSDDQKAFLFEINARGGIGLVVRSVEELERELQVYL